MPNLFKVMAHNPAYLASSWQRVKVVMGRELDAVFEAIGRNAVQ